MQNSLTADARLIAARAWLASEGIPAGPLAAASEDASFRRYFRFTLDADWPGGEAALPQGTSLVLMDAPPEREDSATFVRIARACHARQLPVPAVYAETATAGFAVLEDFGSDLLLPALTAQPAGAEAWYRVAGDLLHNWQARLDPVGLALPPYDAAFLAKEMDLFRDWFVGKHLELTWTADDAAAWLATKSVLIANARQQPQVAVHRDFHARNLMILEASLGVIDFQDAMHGPVTYDLASLLRDAYVEWPLATVKDWARGWFDDCALVARYADAQRLRWFLLTGVQRQLKIAGIFARLSLRDGKHAYLDDIPRVLGYILALEGEYPELDWIIAFIRLQCLPRLIA